MNKHRHLLSALLPPVSYDRDAPNISTELYAEGNCLDAILNKANSVTYAITPQRAGDLIVDWERVLGLPSVTADSYQVRLHRVLLKIAETGGLSIPYFITLARQLGYSISIREVQPFYADINRVGDAIYIADVIYIWQVIVTGSVSNQILFRASSSAAGESLLSFSDPVIEQVFNELKPAHTFVYFAYL